ncbi:MAG: nucleotidyltransferase domain-containing protein [Lachnospiraceae bacterium]|nr:nucleotidyltransferase domain-containing protein [Lachnospiraceae bacterium]MCI9151773.1 nucleotidyltransferase domain-containing protein [Lachnospiraceae bacterium]
MVSDKEKAIFAQVIAYGKQYDVEKLVLFGSRARRDHMEKSDIDLAVYGCADFDNFYYDIQEKVWTLLEFDIINMEEKVSESLRQEISRDGVVLYEKV